MYNQLVKKKIFNNPEEQS